MGAKSFTYWTLGILAILVIFMLMFPAISQDAALIQQLLNNFPPEFSKALGLTNLDLSDALGYYGFLFTYILLIGSIYAMKSGVSVLSEEARVKTTDFLLVKPVSRNLIVSAKIISVLTNLVSQNFIYLFVAFIVLKLSSSNSFDFMVFILISLSLFLVQMFFVAFGLLLSVCIKRVKTVLPITLGVVFGFFVLQLLNQSLSDNKLAYITPFAYFDVPQIIKTSVYKPVFLVLDIVLIIIFTLLAYIIYNKKDMPSV